MAGPRGYDPGRDETRALNRIELGRPASADCLMATGKPIFVQNHIVGDQEALLISRNLREHHDEIVQVLNLMALDADLIDEGLIVHGESDELVGRSPKESADLVFSRVKELGSEGYNVLLRCLEQNEDWHIGHKYAAALLRGDAFTEETKRKINHSVELQQRYRQRDIMKMIEDNVDTSDLIPYLSAYQLLTDNEREELTLESFTRQDRIKILLDIIPTKGPEADFFFMRALADAWRENPVHRDILERVYCQPFEDIIDIKGDASTSSRILGKRKTKCAMISIILYYTTINKKTVPSIPKQTQAHGIILSEEYIKKIKDIRRLHYVGDWNGAEKIVKECWKNSRTNKNNNDSTYTELYVAVALRNCSGYVTRGMTMKVLQVVSEAKRLCRSIDNDNGRVLESKCEWMLAKMYRYKKDFNKSMEHIENAQMIQFKFNIAAGEDTTLCNYCKSCILASQLAKTKQTYESSVTLSPLSVQKASERSKKKYQEAKQCLRKAIDHAAIQDYAIYQSHHMIRLAQLCLHSSQYEAGTCEDDNQITEAEAALNSDYIDENVLGLRTKCLFYVTRSDLYRNKGQLTLAREEAQRAMEIAMNNKFDTEIKSAEVRLAALKLTTTVHSH